MDNKDKNEEYRAHGQGDPNNPDGQGDPQKQPEGGSPKRGPNLFNILILSFILTFIINSLFATRVSHQKLTINYTQFINLVESGNVESAVVESEEIIIKLKDDVNKEDLKEIIPTTNVLPADATQEDIDRFYDDLAKQKNFHTTRVEDKDLTNRLMEYDVNIEGPDVAKSSPVMDFIATWVLPMVIMYIFYMFIIRMMTRRMGGGKGGAGGANPFSVGKSTAKMYDVESNIGVTFDDVAGQEEAKESLVEIIDFINNPKKYEEIGAKQPKGALLVGPPGTGKTLIARAVAGEAKVPFYSLTGSEFVEMFVGVGASRVRDLFEQAEKNAPCIIFIDEIDAIGKKRDGQYGGNDEREQTLNQLLAEMDGFDSSKGIVVLAATNRPESLDAALLRPGRFDRRIIMEKPDLPGRVAILKLHASDVIMEEDIDYEAIALTTSGATGADLANIVNEAALRAVRMNREKVSQDDLMESVEVIIAGKEKKDRILNPEERRIVAFHEVGHALASALQKDAMPVQKITIVPRTMGALGYTLNVPEEERYLMKKDELYAQIVTLLAGRAAEEVEFGFATTGASNDIQKATDIARSMVTQYGMSDTFDMVQLEDIESRYLDGRAVPKHSEKTGARIDEEVTKIIKECHEKAYNLINDNQDKLRRIAEFLIEKETITGEEFMEIFEDKESKEEDSEIKKAEIKEETEELKIVEEKEEEKEEIKEEKLEEDK